MFSSNGLKTLSVSMIAIVFEACAAVDETTTSSTAPTLGMPTNVDCGINSCPSPSDDGGCAADVTEACKKPKASTNEPCSENADCADGICDDVAKRCRGPAFDDHVQNGTETDVDCGGPSPGRRCATGQSCRDHSDCESGGCAFDKRCAMGPSCTQLEGGQTCGPNDVMTKQADCCDRARVGAVTVDKYLITAGRMRAFLTRFDGDVRSFAATLPVGKWNPAWTPRLPIRFDGSPDDGNNANTQLGPYYDKRACGSGNYNGHTFWTPLVYGDTKEDFDRAVLDTKALNCVPWWLLAALCAFDGGHLVKEAELRVVYTNDHTTAYPWGARGAYTTTAQNDYAIQFYSYQTPNPPPDARKSGDDFLDMTYHIAPPGRRPLGYNATGHADLVGNLLEWVGDTEGQFVWKGSFERHSAEADQLEAPLDDDPYLAVDPRNGNGPWHWQDVVAPAADSGNVNGYYGLGGRCAY